MFTFWLWLRCVVRLSRKIYASDDDSPVTQGQSTTNRIRGKQARFQDIKMGVSAALRLRAMILSQAVLRLVAVLPRQVVSSFSWLKKSISSPFRISDSKTNRILRVGALCAFLASCGRTPPPQSAILTVSTWPDFKVNVFSGAQRSSFPSLYHTLIV